MSDYVPGTDEQDPKKVIMALQLAAENISTAQDAIDTNTSDIAAVESDVAANTAAIAANDADISALQTAVTNASFASGTRVLFQQTNAPTGWTKETAHNDKVLRVVSGTASAGGANSFSTVMAQTVVGSTALTLAQIPPHSHSYNATTISSGPDPFLDAGTINIGTTGATTGSAGSGDAHNHSITMNMAYVDIIIGVKN
jgi:hypothetical protein